MCRDETLARVVVIEKMHDCSRVIRREASALIGERGAELPQIGQLPRGTEYSAPRPTPELSGPVVGCVEPMAHIIRVPRRGFGYQQHPRPDALHVFPHGRPGLRIPLPHRPGRIRAETSEGIVADPEG